jgi:RNase H-like domain found in reverse transcriptase
MWTLLRHLLGLASYYREYIEGFAGSSEPLAELTRKNRVFVWTAACQTAMDRIKQEFKTEQNPPLPDFRKPFILTTDWSKCSIQALLSQVDKETNSDHPILLLP